MSKVKRYGYDNILGMIESDYGVSPEWVKSSDYDALQQKLDAVLAENARMLSDYREIPEMRRIGAPLTPATDAILNEVRAGLVAALHKEQLEWALVTWQYNNFDALKRAALRYGDSELSGVIFMLDRIEGFAAQLRAGSKEGGV